MDKTKIEKVKEFFGKLLTPEQKEAFKKEFGDITAPTTLETTPPATATAGTAKLKDGTVIEYDNLGEGGTVLAVGTDGTKLPAPAGEWELEDGTKIVIAEGGKIVSVTAPAATQTQTTPAPTAQNSNDAASKLIDALKGIMENKFAEQAKKIEALETENKTLKETFSKQTETLTTVVAFFNAIGETPTTETATVTEKKSKKQNPLNYL